MPLVLWLGNFHRTRVFCKSTMFRLFLLLLFFCPAMVVEAHLGNENHTEVRVFSDKMRVVIRTSIPFAWSLMGTQAPAMADEAGQALAKPLLIAAAPGLIHVTAGGKPLAPTGTDCVFEVGNDVAFVLNFDLPVEWPVVVEARFFNRFTSLDTGTISVFDHTASRFSRDLEPVVQKTIDQSSPSLSFDLGNSVSRVPPTAPGPPVPEPLSKKPDPMIALWILLPAAGGVGYLAWRRWRSIA